MATPSLSVISDFFSGAGKRRPKQELPVFTHPLAALTPLLHNDLRLTWLGHSTVLIEIDGVRLLTDPVWGARASPVSFAGPLRFHRAPLRLEELGRIDAILLSHDHYDHLDASTWKRLAVGAADWKGPVITMLGVGAHLERLGVAADRIVELDWSEGYLVKAPGAEVEVVATPSQHFSGRSALDRNATLWGGLAVCGPHHRVFFSGDTGPTPEHADIGLALGPFDVVMFEIGAYHEAWGDIHLGPDAAWQAFASIKGRRLLPVHWGTFDLALHAWQQPAERLFEISHGEGLLMPMLGQPTGPKSPVVTEWWRGL